MKGFDLDVKIKKCDGLRDLLFVLIWCLLLLLLLVAVHLGEGGGSTVLGGALVSI